MAVKNKKKIIVLSIVCALLLAMMLFVMIEFWYVARYNSKKTEIEPTDHENTIVMSCNVRCWAIEDIGKKSWFYRADLIRQNLQNVSPDIVGFQEVTKMHYKYLTSILPNYDSVIDYRDKSIASEGCPIFYRKDKYTLKDKGSFWLSETPDVMSKSWDSSCNRVCSYVILIDNDTNKEFVVFNTHLDHKSEQARINGIQLVVDKIAKFGGIPSILMGDMNDFVQSETINYACARFDDAKDKATITTDGGTYQGYGTTSKAIDYFFISKTGIKVNKYDIVNTTYDGVYPSDHFPIYIEVEFE